MKCPKKGTESADPKNTVPSPLLGNMLGFLPQPGPCRNLEARPRLTLLLSAPDTMDFLLMFANYRLDPEKKLQDYQIRNKSTIIIVVQLPGGGPGHQGCAGPVWGEHLVVEPHWSWVGSAGYRQGWGNKQS